MPGRVKRFTPPNNNGVTGFKVPHKQSSARLGPSPVDYGATVRFKVPHMGWNQVRQTTEHKLWQNIAQDSRFYFVHSYYLAPRDPAIIAGTTDYITTFTSAIAQNNIFAVQFHPEKSARAGLQLLENFSRWSP